MAKKPVVCQGSKIGSLFMATVLPMGAETGLRIESRMPLSGVYPWMMMCWIRADTEKIIAQTSY